MSWILETFEHSLAVPILIVAVLCLSFYLLGEANGARFYWSRPLDGPTPPRDPRASMDPERLNDERLELLADKLELKREVERQERLKQRHIKDKAKLKAQK